VRRPLATRLIKMPRLCFAEFLKIAANFETDHPFPEAHGIAGAIPSSPSVHALCSDPRVW
jgi:hypothetical protein